MNNILTLKGNKFKQENRKNPTVQITLPKNSEIKLSHLKNLHSSLMATKEFWLDKQIIEGALISVYYDRIVAKSNRINGYLDGGGNSKPIDTVVGAKFNPDKTKHIITHYISKGTLDKTINISSKVIELFEESFSEGVITDELFNKSFIFDTLNYGDYSLSKSTFKQYLRDAFFVEEFSVEKVEKQDLRNSIVTFYDVNTNIHELLKKSILIYLLPIS